MNPPPSRAAAHCAALLALLAAISDAEESSASEVIEIVGRPELFAPGIASTEASEVRLTVSPEATGLCGSPEIVPAAQAHMIFGYDILDIHIQLW